MSESNVPSDTADRLRSLALPLPSPVDPNLPAIPKETGNESDSSQNSANNTNPQDNTLQNSGGGDSGGGGSGDQANPPQDRKNLDRNVGRDNLPDSGGEPSTTSVWDKIINNKLLFRLLKGVFFNTGGTRLKSGVGAAFTYDNDSINTHHGFNIEFDFKVNFEIGASPIEPKLPQGHGVFTEFRGGVNQAIARYEICIFIPKAIDSNLLNDDFSTVKVDTALPLIGKKQRYNILGFAIPLKNLNKFLFFLLKDKNFWSNCYSPNRLIPLQLRNPKS